MQHYNTKLDVSEVIMLVTKGAIYILDINCNLLQRYEIQYLSQIILVKSNATFMALTFTQGLKPFIL